MRANVRELVEQDGIVRGVRYHTPDGWHEVRAALTVGADGRFSQIRRLCGLQPVVTAATIDVLWFRLPRLPGDPEGASGGLMDCADARREQARALAVPGMVGAISSALNLTPVPSDRGGQPSSAASSCSLLSLPTKSISTRSLPSRSLCDQ